LDLREGKKRESRGKQIKRSFMIGTAGNVTLKKSREMRWTGHVARTGKKRSAYRILL
jgi:hypothetical protein